MFDAGMSHDEIVELAKRHYHDPGHDKDSEPLFCLLVEVAVAYIVQCRREDQGAGDGSVSLGDAMGMSPIKSALVGLHENLELDERVVGGKHLRDVLNPLLDDSHVVVDPDGTSMPTSRFLGAMFDT